MSTRRGPRSAGPDTRETILEAARSAFAARGYDRATIRLIASQAGVDPALVHHYFGKKEDLFAAAVRLPMRPFEAVDELFAGGMAELPGRLTELFFRVWEVVETREALLGQIRMAFIDERPPPVREFIASAILEKVAERLDRPDPDLMVELVASQLVGVAVLRYLMKLEPLASVDIDHLVAELTPRVASYLVG
ncbi:MAG: TetR family transcriptional regulator [Acidimicrobiia bacterium]